MKRRISRRQFVATGTALGLAPALSAVAQTAERYPARPIKMVVGYSPGGGNDLIARIVATRLQGKLGQPVIVENKPGAQSIVAAEMVAKSSPDGYTLLVAPSGPLTINPAVYAKLPYDPVKDFAPLSLLAEFPLLLIVGGEQPVRSVKELVDYGRANPKLANYASSATPFQLAAELFNQRTDSKFQHIPFRGSGDMAQAVMSGQVLMAFADSGPIVAPLKAGKLRALGITTARRPPDFPDVPTMAESGVSDMEISLWTGLVAPAGTPAEIQAMLQDAVVDTLEMPVVKEAMDAISVDARGTSSKEFAELIVRDIARWKAVAAKANIKIE
jgi:tripartite-type tricarboxylate transporter receptor subunit TctC